MHNIRTKYKGFSLLELLIVISIIGILSGIIYVSFTAVRQLTRDDVRMTDLKQLQLAIETYRAQHGRYPLKGCDDATWSGHSPASANWGCQSDSYIQGLVPDFIPKLPIDPSGNQDNKGYFYRVNDHGTSYKLMVHNQVERKLITSYDQEFARCPRSFGSSFCGTDGPQPTTYAVYSIGAEDW